MNATKGAFCWGAVCKAPPSKHTTHGSPWVAAGAGHGLTRLRPGKTKNSSAFVAKQTKPTQADTAQSGYLVISIQSLITIYQTWHMSCF
jgi:hypothetical protein